MGIYEELAEEYGVDLSDPSASLAAALAKADDDFLEDLVALRRETGLTQTQVAQAIGRNKSTICNFERLGTDPRLSTIRRYAAAIGATYSHHLALDTAVHPNAGVENDIRSISGYNIAPSRHEPGTCGTSRPFQRVSWRDAVVAKIEPKSYREKSPSHA